VAAFNSDGTLLAMEKDQRVFLINTATGHINREFGPDAGSGVGKWSGPMQFSPDSRLIVAVNFEAESLSIWSTQSGEIVRELPLQGDIAAALAFSPDSKQLAMGSSHRNVRRWDMASGQELPSLPVPVGGVGHSGFFSVAFSTDGSLLTGSIVTRARSSGDARVDGSIIVWDAQTGVVKNVLEGHPAGTRTVTFSQDSRFIISGGYDGTIKYWDREANQWVFSISAGRGDGWLGITSKGFFNAGGASDELVSVVRGFDIHSVREVYSHLYRPDLVEELLRGDPEGKYRDAAAGLNLDKVLASGPVPQIELLDRSTEQVGGTVRVAIRLTDQGGGIGRRLVWRVNGVTQGDVLPEKLKDLVAPSVGSAVTIAQVLRVDPGQANVIEVAAHNGSGLLATPPFTIIVDRFGATSEERPHLHVLAIGVDKYRMRDYQLSYAVRDARAFANAMAVVGSTLFAKVHEDAYG